MKLKPLSAGQRPTQQEYNKLIKAVNGLMNMKGRNGITVRTSPFGTTLIGSPTSAVGTVGTTLRKAFAAQDAPAGNDITVFLDADATGSARTITCEIVGGSDLNNALPRLVDGSLFYVLPDTDATDGLRSVMTFQATVDCS